LLLVAGGGFVRPTSIATVYAALGDRENMLKWLEKAYTERDGMLNYLSRSSLSGFRDDPQVRAIFAKIGLQ